MCRQFKNNNFRKNGILYLIKKAIHNILLRFEYSLILVSPLGNKNSYD